MISGIDMSSYYRIAQLSRSLDNFMAEITIAKAQLSVSMNSGSGISYNGIGSKIDIYA